MLWHEITGLFQNAEGKKQSWINAPHSVDDTWGGWGFFFFQKRINSMLCLPRTPSTQIRLPLWSKLIPCANLPNRDSEPGGKTGITGTATSAAACHRPGLPMPGAPVFWDPVDPKARRSPGVRTMCTTMAVLTTIALILRQRFSSKITPWVASTLLKISLMKRIEGLRSPLQPFDQSRYNYPASLRWKQVNEFKPLLHSADYNPLSMDPMQPKIRIWPKMHHLLLQRKQK